MASRIELATPEAVETAAALVEGRARAALSRKSHQPRTPTPSNPGEPPALVTGVLRSSFELLGPTSEGAGAWAAVLGPTAPYARVQELGGKTGRGGSVVLPPRPYLAPAAREAIRSGEVREVFVRAWGRAVMG
jgi:hypothetical protein